MTALYPAPAMASLSRVMIIGCGYVGMRLGRALATSRKVLGIVQSTASVERLATAGITGQALDLDNPRSTALDCGKLRALYYLTPPPATGDSDLRLARFLDQFAGQPDVFVYMSTTGVYGDAKGADVTEQTPIKPLTGRAVRRASAEDMVRIWCTEHHVRRIILRVPGIYGPGRLPLEQLRRREPAIQVTEAAIGNRIHVDDLVAACIAAADLPDARGVYNVTDGNSLSQTEFLLQVAQLAGLPMPPLISREEAQLVLGPSRLSFLGESRRVSNRRMLDELKVQLRYADVEEGIKAALEESGSSETAESTESGKRTGG